MINPNTQLIISSSCTQGCSDASSIAYEFKIYKELKFTSGDYEEKWIPCSVSGILYDSWIYIIFAWENCKNIYFTIFICCIDQIVHDGGCNIPTSYVYGWQSNELTLTNSFFTLDTTQRYKIELTATVTSFALGYSTGSSAMIIKKNQLPKSGSCYLSPEAGWAYDTRFSIRCSNWKDSDGKIVKYEFYGNYIYSSSLLFFSLLSSSHVKLFS